MDRILFTPTKYVQGPGSLTRIGQWLDGRFTSCFAVLDPGVEEPLRTALGQAFDGVSLKLGMAAAHGECCDDEVARLVELAAGADVIIGAGGGKTVDIGKAVAARCKAASVIVPTIAASDAPTSSIAIMYSPDHVYLGAVRFPDNPYMILVDTDIILGAPARFLAAGMGDALATRIEAERCMSAGGANLHGHTGTLAALALAREAYAIILTHGKAAMQAVAAKSASPAFEAVVEANILMSGLGWENCGLAIPHALHGALTSLSRFDKAMHGERVALGVLVQLHYDGELDELERLRAFYQTVGLPVAFADIGGGTTPTDEELDTILKLVTRQGSYAHNQPGGLDQVRLAESLRQFV